MPLFEVAVLEQPTKKEREDGVPEKLVFGPKALTANDPQSAAIKAARDPGFPADVDLTRAEVKVRPFG